MRFEAAWYWLLFPPLLAYVWWLSRRSYAQLRPAARWGSVAARLLILLMLIAAVTRPGYLQRSNQGHLVFVLDVSKSVTADNLDAALTEIDRLAREATQHRSPQRVSVVVFGQNAALVVRSQAAREIWTEELRQDIRYQTSLPELYARRTSLISSGAADNDALAKLQSRISAIERFRDRLAGEGTDIEGAMRLALNCGAAGESRTIYVFSDGNFNQGRWPQAWNVAAAAGAKVHAVALNKPLPPEVAAVDLAMPPSVRVHQGFAADLRIASTVATTTELQVYKDGYAEQQRLVELKPGDNLVKLSGLYFSEKGFHTIEVSLRPADDTQLQNNTIRTLAIVPGEARVLYVDSEEKQMSYLQSALELQGMSVEARPASGVPQSLSELLSFDCFILSNVPADRLTLGQMQMIRTYVQDFGGGFLMLGGDQSFGLGGYYGTPVEEVLPVRMPIQKDLNRPSLALMLLIDKSGSMDGVKIELAKRAAIATAEAINPRDQIGLIGFDAAFRVLLELTPAADRATVTTHIAELDAGGGTFMYPALQEAQERLMESNARKKHVIVLSDGQTQGFGYEELVQGMAADGITLSAVGIGEGADMRLLEAMANAGDGRAYFTNDFYSIPQIFTREALRASKSMLVERLVQPVAVGRDASLEEIDTQELPLLTGYVATTPKAAANVVLASDVGDPLLAKWRYGLGWTAAFTSEPKPRWAEDWLQWEDFAKFWGQLVRGITGADLAQTLAVECGHRLDDHGVVLVADVREATGDFALDVVPSLSAVTPDGRTRALEVERRGPGLFEARAPSITYGKDQQFVWRFPNGEAKEQTASYGFVYSCSPELCTLGPAEQVFEQIRERGLGETMSVGNCRLLTNEATCSAWLPLWPYLLAAALVLVPVDIVIRRAG